MRLLTLPIVSCQAERIQKQKELDKLASVPKENAEF
jgi:hypothetical protein